MTGSVVTLQRFKIVCNQLNSMVYVDIPYFSFVRGEMQCSLHPKQAAFLIYLIFIILLYIFTFVCNYIKRLQV